ncbi:MAG: tyrosine-type recombinase/integrase [Candidatus Tectomicrobia bacterium]|nr:tyrosine-type recombinase/integrase [Candidatus Tectomicrobia bacterium]
MSPLRVMLQDYLATRRALGFKLHTDGTGLLAFVEFMESAHADYISTDLALAWAKQPTSVRPARWAQRLSYVRGFARYCRAIDPRTEIPPAGLLPVTRQRPSPYFFTDDDIDRLLQDTLARPAKEGFANHTLYCLFGLLSVSGLRIGEALRLTLDDVDLEEGILTIRATKFGKSRLVPLHETTVQVLVDYRERRAQFLAGRHVPHWFANASGGRLGYDSVRRAFRCLTARLRSQPGRSRPRLHDLRHRFAMMTLLKWYREGHDVQQRLPALSAFLGHVEVSDTYWYLSACPELLEAAKERLEHHWEQPS